MARKCIKRSGHCVVEDGEKLIAIYTTQEAKEVFEGTSRDMLFSGAKWYDPVCYRLRFSAEFPAVTYVPRWTLYDGFYHPERHPYNRDGDGSRRHGGL